MSFEDDTHEADDEIDEVADPDEDLNDADDGDEAGGGVDPPEAGDGQGDDGSEEPAEVAAPTRGQNRIAVLAREAREAKESADASRRELEALRAERSNYSNEQAAARERERIELMSPDERADYRVSQLERKTEHALARMEFNSADASDKVAFDAKAAGNPAVAAVAAEVEEALKAMRANGTNAPRQTVAAYLIGQKALERAPRARSAATRSAEANRARQTVRASTGRGDVAAGSGRSLSESAARDKRLADMEI